jgi:hypothetical protein
MKRDGFYVCESPASQVFRPAARPASCYLLKRGWEWKKEDEIEQMTASLYRVPV